MFQDVRSPRVKLCMLDSCAVSFNLIWMQFKTNNLSSTSFLSMSCPLQWEVSVQCVDFNKSVLDFFSKKYSSCGLFLLHCLISLTTPSAGLGPLPCYAINLVRCFLRPRYLNLTYIDTAIATEKHEKLTVKNKAESEMDYCCSTDESCSQIVNTE